MCEVVCVCDSIGPESPGELMALSSHFLGIVICTLDGDQMPTGWSSREDTPLPVVTSACSAARANTQHGGGVLHGGGRGLQHSLHVLVLSGILSIAQALGLAQRHWRTARELARLQDQRVIRA